MREIKFRAWSGTRMMFKTLDDNNWYDGPETKAKLIREKSTSDCRKYKVMQYTGLKDKNGVEIYEGDVVSFADLTAPERKEERCTIVFYESRAQFLPQDIKENHKGGNYIHHWDMLEGVAVIGNIYENPELLR